MEKEIWKSIPELPDVHISNFGRIRKIVRPFESSLGYQSVGLNYKGHHRMFLVHRLVAAAYLGLDLFDSEIHACHKDDNPKNNRASNLFLGTHQDNVIDKVSKHRQLMGAQIHCAKLTDEDVRKIIKLRDTHSTIELAAMFNVTKGTVSKIVNGKIWKHVSRRPRTAL